MMNSFLYKVLKLLVLFFGVSAFAQTPKEDEYYKIITIPVPEGILLEVGGVVTLPDGRVGLSTRRGDVWVVENPYMRKSEAPKFTLFASGLHEPLGLAYKDNSFYVAQRGELTRLADTDGDGMADVYETIYAWPLSGHYHEYSYGPKIAPDGSMFVTANVAFGDQEWWRGESRVPWRGWTMRIDPDGNMEPWATGMRSPCGIGMIDGEFFYADNQGDWMGSGGIWHVTKGSFTGHPAGLVWSSEPNSPVELTKEEFLSKIDERRIKEGDRYIKPENIENEEDPLFLYEAKEMFPEAKLPAIWLPHAVLGISNAELLEDETNGRFGPFSGQIFIGDQGQSKIMRVVLEQVDGAYQGVAFDFREGFQSGVLRMDWGNDGSLFVGETNRGWGSAGTENSGFQRLVWTGEVPVEMKTVRAKPDGFEIEFTKPVNRETAEDLDSYGGRSFLYKYHSVYGSPTVNDEQLDIKAVQVSEDGMKVRLVVENLRRYHLHQIDVPGIRSQEENLPVLHPTAYYTLNNIPEGEKLSLTTASTSRSSEKATKRQAPVKASPKPGTDKAVLTYEQVKPLLDRNTCSACHQVGKRQVGPSFTDIAKRRYSDRRIVGLIHQPEPHNWPEYATEMPPMPQVPEKEALKIAAWINSLVDGD